MRKLTVKNFSVINEAELEFGKITVLIGPQASGKSLLCKLAYFLGNEAPNIVLDTISFSRKWEDVEAQVLSAFSAWFPSGSWGNEQLLIRFESHFYKVEVSRIGIGTASQPLNVTFSNELQELFVTLVERNKLPPGDRSEDLREIRANAWYELMALQANDSPSFPAYIPAGRAFFTGIEAGYATLENPAIEQVVRRFGGLIVWNSSRWKIGLLSSERRMAENLDNLMERIAGGKVVIRGNTPDFESLDHRTLPLNMLSSGTQELLPLFNVLSRFAYSYEHESVLIESFGGSQVAYRPVRKRPLLYLEEPEAHIFPSTQYELVQLFSWMANDPMLSFEWVITTHSPYILSSFNNLLEAWQVARAKPELKDEVATLIPEQYWIKEGDFKAYAIEDGVLTSIVAKDTGLVSANYLDQVSERIGVEFDELLRLGYVES
ncbi:MAG: AAA family ATPase [Terracidiphilus sp.]|jgi:predicted ATPase